MLKTPQNKRIIEIKNKGQVFSAPYSSKFFEKNNNIKKPIQEINIHMSHDDSFYK
jgi:UPF0288 family protein (methanogenesis marker protein 3)